MEIYFPFLLLNAREQNTKIVYEVEERKIGERGNQCFLSLLFSFFNTTFLLWILNRKY
jgi:hypothetical protein